MGYGISNKITILNILKGNLVTCELIERQVFDISKISAGKINFGSLKIGFFSNFFFFWLVLNLNQYSEKVSEFGVSELDAGSREQDFKVGFL